MLRIKTIGLKSKFLLCEGCPNLIYKRCSEYLKKIPAECIQGNCTPNAYCQYDCANSQCVAIVHQFYFTDYYIEEGHICDHVLKRVHNAKSK